jgi:hypothetical protein
MSFESLRLIVTRNYDSSSLHAEYLTFINLISKDQDLITFYINSRVHTGDAVVRVVERIRIEIDPFENNSEEQH